METENKDTDLELLDDQEFTDRVVLDRDQEYYNALLTHIPEFDISSLPDNWTPQMVIDKFVVELQNQFRQTKTPIFGQYKVK